MIRLLRKAGAKTLLASIVVLQTFCAAVAAEGSAEQRRILVYGDSNVWGWVPTERGFPTVRLSDAERFPGVLEATLGAGYTIIVDGLNNRTTNLPEPQAWGNVPGQAFDGAAELPQAIARAMPLDLVVILLGTNDTKSQFARSAEEIARAAIGLSEVVSSSTGVATEYTAPGVLIIAPPPFGPMNHAGIAQYYAGGDITSSRFAEAYLAEGAASNVSVFLAQDAMGTSDGFDGIHFTSQDHRLLGQALASVVRGIIE